VTACGVVIDGSVAIVTGAARGIGLAISRELADQGAYVVLTDSDPRQLEDALRSLRQYGARVTSVECDVTSDASVDAMIDYVTQQHGRIDILVNNAGVGLGGPVESIPIDEWRWIIDVNLLGVVRCWRAVLPAMISRGSGHIVNVASSAALFADSPQAIPYVATKSAVWGASRALRAYLLPKGIGVTVLCPDNTDTGFRDRARVVGIDRSRVTSTLSQAHFEPPEFVARALIEAMRAGQFLVAMSANASARLIADAKALADS
jgi:NAD(P)-dependent dehydrogenase (short-subunit alcohol dehydrogenase family)